MKIISWNCNGKFREKFKEIINLNADIYVIQECENPESTSIKEYKEFANNYIWVGNKNSKGLGIFAKNSIELSKNNWQTYCLQNFCSVRINNKFDLLGVWADPPYIEEYYIYQNINFTHYNSNTIIIGDFNSNAIWDKKNQKRNHLAVVNELKKIGLYSAYHFTTREEQGKEKQNTFYLHKYKSKAYHIDHCFCNSNIIKDYEVLDDDKWLKYSDHVPIMLDINELAII